MLLVHGLAQKARRGQTLARVSSQGPGFSARAQEVDFSLPTRWWTTLPCPSGSSLQSADAADWLDVRVALPERTRRISFCLKTGDLPE